MSYERVKYYFEAGLWSEPMVKMAVRKGVITQEQCDAIIAGTASDEATDADYLEALTELGVNV